MSIAMLPGLAADFLIAFGRVGALIMLLPAVGERVIPARQRLALALFLTLMVMPVAAPMLPARREGAVLIGLLVSEILIGLVIGVAARLVMAAMETGGSLIAQTIGLSFAQTVDPTQGQQGEIVANLMRLVGVMLILSSDLHHVAISGVFDSYLSMPPGTIVIAGDAADLTVRLTGEAFAAAIRVAAPFLVFGFLFNAGLGFAARLAPQIQLFFLAMPVSIIGGLAALGLVLGVTGGLFTDFVAGVFAMLFTGGR